MPRSAARRLRRADPLAVLGARVKEVRVARRLTQSDLAEQVGICVAYMSLIERGERNPPLTRVVELARALGVNTTVLGG